MAMRLTGIGALLSIIGVTLLWWPRNALRGYSYPQTTVERLQLEGMALLPGLGAALTVVGAVVLAAAVLAALTGHPPVAEMRHAVLWLGLAVVVLCLAGERLMLSDWMLSMLAQEPREAWIRYLDVVVLLRGIGAALVGLWCAGMVSGARTPARSRPADRALAPSPPF